MHAEESEIDLIIIAGTILLLFLVSFIVLFMLFYQNRYFQQKRKIKQMEEEFDREILKAQLEIQEIELKRVSLEIHDNVGQMLSLVKLNLNVLEARMVQNTPDTKMVSETKNLVTDIIVDLRNLSKSLSSDLVKRFGFVQALQFETERIQLTEQYVCNVLVDGESIRLPLDTEIILFRMVQESLQNIIKHSKANQIEIHLTFNDTELIAEVRDNGIGFNPAKYIDEKNLEGSGLRNLFSRARLIGAILEILSSAENGSCIKIKLPLVKRLVFN